MKFKDTLSNEKTREGAAGFAHMLIAHIDIERRQINVIRETRISGGAGTIDLDNQLFELRRVKDMVHALIAEVFNDRD